MQARSASDVKLIDVSHHQGSIDWTKVKADGVAGAFIKATEGRTGIDIKFSSYTTMAVKEGLKVGYYHYARPENGNSPEDEAANFYRTVKGFPADFPHVLDVEGDAAKLGADALTKWCVKWCTEVEKLSGHPVMIYTGASFAKSYLGKALNKWPLWVAHYGTNDPMDNTTWSRWAVFQYTSSGKVSGIAGNVDIDAMDKAFFDKYVKPEAGEMGVFKDVPAGHYAEAAIERLAAEGVMNGISATEFGFNKPITRQDAAVILDRAIELMRKEMNANG